MISLLRPSNLFIFVLLIFGFSGLASADSPAGFADKYNLFVTDENRDQPVPYAKGIQVLESYFLGTPLKPAMENPDDMMSQKEFLMAFEMLRVKALGQELSSDDSEIYYKAWLNARRHNWLPKPELTYGTLQEFLYRYQVSLVHADLPYYEALVLDNAEINADRFTTIAQVKVLEEKLLTQITQVRLMGAKTEASAQLEAQLQAHYQAFLDTEKEIIRRNSPINKIPNLPEDIKQKITDNNLTQILDQMTYHYGSNTYNRKFNLVKGAMQMNGRLYQPGEEMSFTQALREGEGGLNGYMDGWTLHGKEEVWEYGGGLCGSATMFFTPSWRAGLEVVFRKNHSVYYSSLYPPEAKGLDATIYFGYLDVVMKNNTSSPILYYVYDNKETQDVTLYVIGNSPYTEVNIEGPIKTSAYGYQYIRHMTLPDGTVISEPINSRYQGMY